MPKWNKYFTVFYQSAENIFQYRFDFFAHTTKYALMVILMALVWVAVGNTTDSLGLTQSETVIYFFFAAMLYSLSNFHTYYIEEDIRLGTLSRYLLRPVNSFSFYMSFQAASAVIETSIKMAVMLPLLFLLGYGFQVPLQNLVLFILFLPIIYFFSFNLFTMISTLGFWLKEVYAIRWALTIVVRFMAGTLMPISFLPLNIQKIFFWFPFQHSLYTPVSLLQQKISTPLAVQSLFILLIWSGILFFLRRGLWQWGLKTYESTGI